MLTNKKAVTAALGGNPRVKTKGEGMSNGFSVGRFPRQQLDLTIKKGTVQAPFVKNLHPSKLRQPFPDVVRHRSRLSPVCRNLLQSRVYVLTCGFICCKALWDLSAIPSLLIEVNQRGRDKSAIVFAPLICCFHPFNVLNNLVGAAIVQAFFPSCQTNRLSTFAD
jgi:hypothetical protein